MKKVIERLEQVKSFLDKAYQFSRDEGVDNMLLLKRIVLLTEAIAELKARPRWETPEQWKKRTGEAWPGNGAVYALAKLGWIAMSYTLAKMKSHYDDGFFGFVTVIVCATEAGPPPNNWWPEEGDHENQKDHTL